jgi:prevent-host-death family protein
LCYESCEPYDLQHDDHDTLSEARAHLGEVVRKARYSRGIVELTEHGEPAAEVIGPEMLEFFLALRDAADLAEAARITAEGRPTVPHAEVAARFGLTSDGRRL